MTGTLSEAHLTWSGVRAFQHIVRLYRDINLRSDEIKDDRRYLTKKNVNKVHV